MLAHPARRFLEQHFLLILSIKNRARSSSEIFFMKDIPELLGFKEKKTVPACPVE
jgi:hypothetical protein